jgi:predicted RNase H-like nuclease (RuvC/YqgF family)
MRDSSQSTELNSVEKGIILEQQRREIERLNRDLKDMRDNIQAHSMIVNDAEKDAEIEGLKEENSAVQNSLVEQDMEIDRLKEARDLYFKRSSDQALEITDLKILITELADALYDPEFHPWSYLESLILKAREVVGDDR